MNRDNGVPWSLRVRLIYRGVSFLSIFKNLIFFFFNRDTSIKLRWFFIFGWINAINIKDFLLVIGMEIKFRDIDDFIKFINRFGLNNIFIIN
jgi:hypothetical protein